MLDNGWLMSITVRQRRTNSSPSLRGAKPARFVSQCRIMAHKRENWLTNVNHCQTIISLCWSVSSPLHDLPKVVWQSEIIVWSLSVHCLFIAYTLFTHCLHTAHSLTPFINRRKEEVIIWNHRSQWIHDNLSAIWCAWINGSFCT